MLKRKGRPERMPKLHSLILHPTGNKTVYEHLLKAGMQMLYAEGGMQMLLG